MRLNSLFCGAGGMDLGFRNAGYEIVGAWDWDKYAVKSYAANLGDHVRQINILEMTWQDLPAADVWSFGFPCQDLSVAGQQRGMRLVCSECGHDYPLREQGVEGGCPRCSSMNVAASTRSGLFFEVMRLLQETRRNAPDQLPRVIVAENVKGLGPYLGTLEKEYERAGYCMYVQLYNSKYWGVPQSRERYFVVGIRNDLDIEFQHPVQVTSNVPRLRSILEPVVDEKYYMSDEKARTIIDAAYAKLRESGREIQDSVEDIQHFYVDKDGCAYCCDANYAKGTSAGDLGSGRRTQVIEKVPMFSGGYVNLAEVAATSEEPEISVIGRLDIRGKDQWKRVFDPEGLSPTLTAVQGGLQEAKIFDYGRYRVRKLTPREYARLQGFPDTYQFVCSNAQIYKQLGNAVTVNVAEAVATAIHNVLGGTI